MTRKSRFCKGLSSTSTRQTGSQPSANHPQRRSSSLSPDRLHPTATEASGLMAIESAEITLMRSDLTQIPAAIELSALTLQNIKQNLFWAFGYNVALIPIAAGILAPFPFVPDSLRQLHPIMAAVAMILSDLVIVANALRLRRLRI